VVVVTNWLNRPIRNVAAKIRVFDGISPGKKLADVVGRMEEVHIASGATDKVLAQVVPSLLLVGAG
jgi:hypothetical protein